MIPGVATFHPRTVWEPLAGVRTVAEMNPPRQVPSDIYRPVAHYPAADDLIDGDPGEHADQLPQWVANMHRHYVNVRGYAIGYLFTIDWLGGVWELRGFDYRSAANAGHNHYTAPIQFMVDGDDAPTAEAMASARAVWREFRRRSGRNDFESRPWGHGELHARTSVGTVTPCPGAGITRALADGLLDLDYTPPTPTPIEEEVDPMTVPSYLWRPKGYHNVFAVIGADIIHVSPTTLPRYEHLGPIVDDDHRQLLENAVHRTGATLVPIK